MTEAGFMNQAVACELPPEDAKAVLESLVLYLSRVTKKECDCGRELPMEPENVEAYLHEGGWRLGLLPGRWWLYITCPGCNYQWALWKLGVPR